VFSVSVCHLSATCVKRWCCSEPFTISCIQHTPLRGVKALLATNSDCIDQVIKEFTKHLCSNSNPVCQVHERYALHCQLYTFIAVHKESSAGVEPRSAPNLTLSEQIAISTGKLKKFIVWICIRLWHNLCAKLHGKSTRKPRGNCHKFHELAASCTVMSLSSSLTHCRGMPSSGYVCWPYCYC